jgi:hypothetical protein
VNLKPVQDVILQIRTLLDAWRNYDLPVYHTREGMEGESVVGNTFSNTGQATDQIYQPYQVVSKLALRTILLALASVTKVH